jgi:hypothetical protein
VREVKIEDSHDKEARDRFLAALRLLREEVGQPSLSQLVKLGGHKFSKSTLDDQLAGRRSRLPSWRFVAAYVEACHAAADSTGLDVSRLGTIDQWRTQWLTAFRNPISETSLVAQLVAEAAQVAENKTTRALDLSTMRDIVSTPSPPISYPSEFVRDPSASTDSIRVAVRRNELSELEHLPNTAGMLVITNDIPSDQVRFLLDDDSVMIGRAKGSGVRLDNESVSRRHAIIRRDGIRFSIRDAGSANGTYLNQQRVITEERLKSRQEIQIGIYRLLFVQGKQRRA